MDFTGLQGPQSLLLSLSPVFFWFLSQIVMISYFISFLYTIGEYVPHSVLPLGDMMAPRRLELRFHTVVRQGDGSSSQRDRVPFLNFHTYGTG